MSDSSNKPILNVKDVMISYGEDNDRILAIEHVNLSIARGDFVCILGPSGCGKSTLLKALAGYITPNHGTCTMFDQPIEGPDWHRGVVFQSPTLYPWMKVKENVMFGPKSRKLNEGECNAVAEHFLHQVQLEGFEDKYTFELSGGMKQRVALARVLANYPQVILMDEPLGALDALTRTNMQSLIRDIWKENDITMVLITHDIDEALTLGTKIAVMSKRPGKIIREVEADFTHTIAKEGTKDIMYSQAYLSLKKEVLSLINDQIADEQK